MEGVVIFVSIKIENINCFKYVLVLRMSPFFTCKYRNIALYPSQQKLFYR
jgi:hypothetical protein